MLEGLPIPMAAATPRQHATSMKALARSDSQDSSSLNILTDEGEDVKQGIIQPFGLTVSGFMKCRRSTSPRGEITCRRPIWFLTGFTWSSW